MKLQEIKQTQETEGGIVIAKDYGINGAKSFLLTESYESFLDILKKNKNNHYYEVFEKGSPWNFVMDLDIMSGDEFFATPDILIRDLVEIFFTNIDEYAGKKCEEEAVIVLESPATEVKKSYHIIFRLKNIYFENHSSVKHFSKIFGDYIDQAIYSSNRCFRTIYSSKKTNTGKCLILNNKLSDIPEEYDYELNSFGSYCIINDDSYLIKSKELIKPKQMKNIPIYEFDLKEILFGLNADRYTKRNLWLNIGYLVKGYSEDAFVHFYEFSKQWPDCKKNDVLIAWNSIKPEKNSHESINELINIYNSDNPDNHYKTPEQEEEYNIEYSASLLDTPKECVDYLNKFIVRYDNPKSYGFRRFTNEPFQLLQNITVDVGVSQMKLWNNSFNKNKKRGLNFRIEGDLPDYHNLYIRPSMKVGPTPEPLLYYLKNIISNKDEELYNWIIQYIHTIIKKGKTDHAIVLMGKKGAGKSSFVEIISMLIGEDYFFPVSDINKLNDPFNAEQETTILYGVEELATNAGEFHKVQEKLKTDITEKFKRIRKMNTNPYKIECYNNYILSTNGLFPVPITDDNRRFVVVEVSNEKIGKGQYFIDLKDWVNKNKEYIRYYFYHMEFTSTLEATRPTTEKEIELREFNKTPECRFLEEEEPTFPTPFRELYLSYCEFCKETGEKSQKAKFFSHHLKLNGYETFKKGKKNVVWVRVV